MLKSFLSVFQIDVMHMNPEPPSQISILMYHQFILNLLKYMNMLCMHVFMMFCERTIKRNIVSQEDRYFLINHGQGHIVGVIGVEIGMKYHYVFCSHHSESVTINIGMTMGIHETLYIFKTHLIILRFFKSEECGVQCMNYLNLWRSIHFNTKLLLGQSFTF